MPTRIKDETAVTDPTGFYTPIDKTDGSTTGKSILYSDLSTSIKSGTAVREGLYGAGAVNTQGSGIVIDGLTTGKRVEWGSMTSQQIGTGDFSVRLVFLMPSQANAGTKMGLWAMGSSAATKVVNNGIYAYVDGDASNDITVTILDGAAAVLQTIVATGSGAKYANTFVDFVFTRSGNNVAIYLNGYSSTTASNSNWASTVIPSGSNYWHIGGIESPATNIFSGTFRRFTPYNRLLSATDVLRAAQWDLDPADLKASQVAAYTSSFTATADGWTGTNVVQAGNIDTITDGTTSNNDNLRSYADATNGNHIISKSGQMVAGRRYRLTYTYYRPSGNTNVKGYQIQSGSCIVYTDHNSPTIWTTRTIEFVAQSTQLDFYMSNGSSAISFAGANSVTNDLVYIRGVTLTRIGAWFDADLGSGAGFTIHDASGNGWHGLVASSGIKHWKQKRTEFQIRYSTNTSGNQRILNQAGIEAGANNAKISSWVINSSGTPNVTLGTASAGSEILASTAVVSGENYMAVTGPFLAAGASLWVNSTSTATLQHTITLYYTD